MMRDQVTFSVIVPVYNMGQYLARCIDSVFSQEYEGYELIAVDDGSTDESPEMLDDYQKRFDKIKVIHKKNGGIGTAISVGIKEAGCDYIVFVDSDDYIDKEMLTILRNNLTKSGMPDVIQFGLRMVDEAGHYICDERHGNYRVEGSEVVLRDHFQDHPTPSLACRAFRRELFAEVMCPGQNVGIDEILIIQLLAKANTLVSIDEVLYNVYLRSNSVSRSLYSKHKIQEYKNVYKLLFDFAQHNTKMLWNYITIKYLKLLIGILSEIRSDDPEYYELWNEFRRCYVEVKNVKEFRKEKLSFKTGAALFYRSPIMYQKLKEFQRK